MIQLIGQYLRSVLEHSKNGGGEVGPDAATIVVSVQWMLLFDAVSSKVRVISLPNFYIRTSD